MSWQVERKKEADDLMALSMVYQRWEDTSDAIAYCAGKRANTQVYKRAVATFKSFYYMTASKVMAKSGDPKAEGHPVPKSELGKFPISLCVQRLEDRFVKYSAYLFEKGIIDYERSRSVGAGGTTGAEY